jgi:hypothetical protein
MLSHSDASSSDSSSVFNGSFAFSAQFASLPMVLISTDGLDLYRLSSVSMLSHSDASSSDSSSVFNGSYAFSAQFAFSPSISLGSTGIGSTSTTDVRRLKVCTFK